MKFLLVLLLSSLLTDSMNWDSDDNRAHLAYNASDQQAGSVSVLQEPRFYGALCFVGCAGALAYYCFRPSVPVGTFDTTTTFGSCKVLNQGDTTAVQNLIDSNCLLKCAGATAATCLAASKVQTKKLLESTKDYCKAFLQNPKMDDSKPTESFMKNWKEKGLEFECPQNDKDSKIINQPQNDKDSKIINQEIPTSKLKWGAKDGDVDALKALAYFKDNKKLAAFFERNKSLMTGKRVYELGTKVKSTATGDSVKAEFNLTDADKEQYKNDSTTPIVTSDKFVKFAEAVATEAAKPSSKLPWSELKTIIGDDFAPQNENGNETDRIGGGEGKDYQLSRTSTLHVNARCGEFNNDYFKCSNCDAKKCTGGTCDDAKKEFKNGTCQPIVKIVNEPEVPSKGPLAQVTKSSWRVVNYLWGLTDYGRKKAKNGFNSLSRKSSNNGEGDAGKLKGTPSVEGKGGKGNRRKL